MEDDFQAPINKYEVVGRLREAIIVLGKENDGKTRGEREKRETNASEKTRHESPKVTQAKRQCRQTGNGACLTGGKGGGQLDESRASPLQRLTEPGQGGNVGATQTSAKGTWATVSRKANKATPGNVSIASGSLKKDKEGSGGKRGKATSPPPKEKRDTGVIKVEITRERDWRERKDLLPEELIQQVRLVAGDKVATGIGSMRVYEGGDTKITPRAWALQDDLSWITEWAPSAVPGGQKWKEIVIHGVLYKGLADEALERIYDENEEEMRDIVLGACTWLGRLGLQRTKTALKVRILDTVGANSLIRNGVFLNYYHLKVSRFWERGPGSQGARDHLFPSPTPDASEGESMDEDHDLSQSPSPIQTPIEREETQEEYSL